MNINNCVYRTTRGTLVTDSLYVAEVLGRQHKNIRKSCMRVIGQGLQDCFYETKRCGHKVFVMTQKGFSAIVRTLPDDAKDGIHAFIAAFVAQGEPSKPATIEVEVKAPGLFNEDGHPTHTDVAIAVEHCIDINTDKNFCVDARQLHAFLGSQRHFVDWFEYRCKQYGFVKDVDFAISVHKNVQIGSPARTFAITMDMAKELAMVEGNEKGKIARRYFIEAEKNLRQVVAQHPAIPTTFAEALRLAASQAEQIEAQQKQIEQDAPKVAFANAIISSPSKCGIDELAKIICQNGVQIGEIRLFAWMRENGYLCNHGTAYNQPTQKALDLGVLEIMPRTWTHPHTGETMTTTRPMVTGKGKQYFINKFIYNDQQRKE